MLKANHPPPTMWPHSTPRGHDFYSPEFTLHEDAATQVSAYRAE